MNTKYNPILTEVEETPEEKTFRHLGRSTYAEVRKSLGYEISQIGLAAAFGHGPEAATIRDHVLKYHGWTLEEFHKMFNYDEFFDIVHTHRTGMSVPGPMNVYFQNLTQASLFNTFGASYFDELNTSCPSLKKSKRPSRKGSSSRRKSVTHTIKEPRTYGPPKRNKY